MTNQKRRLFDFQALLIRKSVERPNDMTPVQHRQELDRLYPRRRTQVIRASSRTEAIKLLKKRFGTMYEVTNVVNYMCLPAD